jgi:hypothetical protein
MFLCRDYSVKFDDHNIDQKRYFQFLFSVMTMSKINDYRNQAFGIWENSIPTRNQELGIRNRKIGVENRIIFNPKTRSTLQSLIGIRNSEFEKKSISLFTIDKQIYRLPPQLGSHSI